MKLNQVKRAYVWLDQLPVDYSTSGVANPVVINTWYTVESDLSDGKPAKLGYILVEQTNNGATAEDLEIEITIINPDGSSETITWTITGATNGTPYFLYFANTLLASTFQPIQSTSGFVAFGKSSADKSYFNVRAISQIRVRQTSAVDLVSAYIEFNMDWKKLTAVSV